MIEIVRSNRLEALVEALAQRLDDAPLRDPMQVERIAVPSRGMERWLAQRLSQRLGATYGNGGVCAHVDFPFPAKVVRQLLARAEFAAQAERNASAVSETHAGPVDDPWEPDAMTWAVLDALGELLDHPTFAPLARYLERDAEAFAKRVDRRAYALARRIAKLFDTYDLHRPTLVRAFTQGANLRALEAFGLRAEEAWQPALWRAVAQRLVLPSFAARLHAGLESLRACPQPNLPRVSVFGISAMPALQLAALDAVSERVEVSIYLLAPSSAYWADIRSRREQIRAQAKQGAQSSFDFGSDSTTGRQSDPASGLSGAELDANEGHPLLASLGGVARDFQVIVERDLLNYADREVFVDPAEPDAETPPSMLAQLQSDMLHLRNRGAGQSDASGMRMHPPAQALSARDRSVEVHGCHGETRQVEVLRDRLLAAFEAEPNLEPRDVLVMCPDIERFAPLIPSVFSQGARAPKLESEPGAWGRTGTPRLPFYVADRSLAASNPVAAALLELLELVPSRMKAGAVLDFLAHEVVRSRFDIQELEVERVRAWIHEAGARWGIDGRHRAHFDQPEQSLFTWQFALRRLSLGVAMRDEGEPFGGYLPFDDMEGGGVDLLGRLLSFTEALFGVCRELAPPRALDAWGASLYEAVDALFATTQGQRWWAIDVRRELDDMLADAGEFEIPVELTVVQARLTERLSRGGGAVGHHTGAITFCAMAPMRSVPHKIVCLLGMSDGAFPRSEAKTEFDLLRRRPRLGDPSPRNEDRFLLLEAVLAARDKLIITYEGRDAARNVQRPLAVPIAELLDHLARAFTDEHGEDVRAQVVTLHPLSSHDAAYFSANARLPAKGERPKLDQLFDRERLRVAEAARSAKSTAWHPPKHQANADLSAATSEVTASVSLAQLCRDLNDPSTTYLRHTLGVNLPRDEDEIPDREVVDLDGLARWQLRRQLNDILLEPKSQDEATLADLRSLQATLLARGRLPAGNAGELALRDARKVVLEAWARLELRAGERLALKDLSVRVDGITVHGRAYVDPAGRAIHLSPGKLGAGKYRLAPWAQYLLFQASHEGACHLAAAGNDSAESYAGFTTSAAHDELSKLVGLWQRARNEPLALLVDSGWELARARARAKAGSPSRAWMKPAATAFEGGSFSGATPERDQLAFQLLWGQVPDYASFERQTETAQLAYDVFDPAIRAAASSSPVEDAT